MTASLGTWTRYLPYGSATVVAVNLLPTSQFISSEHLRVANSSLILHLALLCGSTMVDGSIGHLLTKLTYQFSDR